MERVVIAGPQVSSSFVVPMSASSSPPVLSPQVDQPAGPTVRPVNGAARFLVVPFGTGTPAQTTRVGVYAWNMLGTLWVPHLIGVWTATLGTTLGVAGHVPDNTMRLAHTIADSSVPQPASSEYIRYQSTVTSDVGALRGSTAGALMIEVRSWIVTASGAAALVMLA